MSGSEWRLDWQRGLPRRFLDGEEKWNDDDFLPEGASKDHRAIFRTVYRRYFSQICESDGFDIDIYPGKAKAAMYEPFLDFNTEIDLLTDLANHAIQEYNRNETNVFKYKLERIETVNFILAEQVEYFMTVKVHNSTLHTTLRTLATFQICAYRGPNGENVVRLCRRKPCPISELQANNCRRMKKL